MFNAEVEETREFWNRIADDWQVQVGEEGDRNRILNSDPVLWAFLGDVSGQTVLDAGCGTGYLSRQLARQGARVTGVDFSERMIEIACSRAPEIPFFVDSCCDLATQGDGQFDRLVANYVLMDLPDLEGAIGAFYRVLRPGGIAVLVFSHPCFPAGRIVKLEGGGIAYQWPKPYFETAKCVDPPWSHFTSDFIWFHRPLSDYWKAFNAAGFVVTGFEEPRLSDDRVHLAANTRESEKLRTRPYSVVFQLSKPQVRSNEA